jgi:hypothetical protein
MAKKKLNVPWWGWTLGAIGAAVGGTWYWNRAYPRGVIVIDPATKVRTAREVYPTFLEARQAARDWEHQGYSAQIVDLPKGTTSFQQLQTTAGLGGSDGSDCGCGGGSTSGLGMVPPETWYGAGDDYRPLPGAILDARQRMIHPLPSQG